jgi:X-X-X-Leu-X-X-Gly heptad repeat protein
MAEPSLKDVLSAISELRVETRADLARLDGKFGQLDGKFGQLDGKFGQLDTKVGQLDAKLDAHRAETKKGFEDLDRELTGHADLHRKIEKDISALKRRTSTTAPRAPRRSRTR